MFGKLKDKLKKWTKKVSGTDEVQDEIPEEIEEKEKTPKKDKKQKKSKEQTKKSKQEKSKEKETKTPDEEIDLKLKKEVSKEKYKEPEKEFNAGTLSHEPDLEKKKKEIQKGQDLNEILQGKLPIEIPAKIKETKEKEEPKEKPREGKKGFFRKLFSEKKKITEDQFEDYSEDLEMILLENNVALEVTEKIIQEIKEQIINKEFSKKELEKIITGTLEEKIKEVLIEPFNIIKEIKEKQKNYPNEPYTIIFCGVNGAGKTTTIAKIAHLLKKEKINSVMGAGDTFRAASIEQLKNHGEKLKVPVIAQKYGADPAAVAFDAKKYAKKNNIPVVLIDTAGRMHTAKNLLQEMEKIKRIAKPDRTIFLGEAITGNDSVDQVKAFDETIGIDGIILSKADIDEKGGTALSVGYVTKKPILFLGTGQEMEDIIPFDKEDFIKKLGL